VTENLPHLKNLKKAVNSYCDQVARDHVAEYLSKFNWQEKVDKVTETWTEYKIKEAVDYRVKSKINAIMKKL
jgi:hypothetical protein